MKIDDPNGYAVGGDGTVHHRYAPHAAGLPRSRTLTGVQRLGGRKPCPVCYPPPKRKGRRCAS